MTALDRGVLARRGPRIALVAIAVLVVALAAGTATFLAGVEISGEFLRAPIERALTVAFRVPTSIEGPLRLRTGLHATVSADALVLADPAGAAGATLARGVRPVARIDLPALLRRVVTLEEVTGERLELTLRRDAHGRANWAPLFASSPDGGKAAVAFGGIARLRIGTVSGSYYGKGVQTSHFAISTFEGALPRGAPMTASGTTRIGLQTFAFRLRSASLADLARIDGAFPVQGSLEWSGVRAEVDGRLDRDGARFDAEVHAVTDDAREAFAALGLTTSQFGPLDLRMRLDVTATEALARELTVTFADSAISGSAGIAWAEPRVQVSADLAGERVDFAPFAFGSSTPKDVGPFEALLEWLDGVATGVDADIRLALGELGGLSVAATQFRFEGRSLEGFVSASGDALVQATPLSVRVDYDARQAQRSLKARIEAGEASTDELPPEARLGAVTGRVAGVRGQLLAQGTDGRAMVTSLQGYLEAHDLHWMLRGRQGPPISGRLDRLRVTVQGERETIAEASGKLGDAACRVRIAGGALASLVEGGSWPLQVAGTCPGERINAKGQVAIKERHVVADLSFSAVADRAGAAMQALGIAPSMPRPISARGVLSVQREFARLQLSTFQLGRSGGSGEIALPLGADGAPRAKLALTRVDLDELGATRPHDRAGTQAVDRRVLSRDMRLPDVDFEITTDLLTVAGAQLRRLQLNGAVRSRKLEAMPFRFEWGGARLQGRFGADFSGSLPRVDFDATAKDADLGAVLARLGQDAVGLHAGEMSLRASAEGERLGELLNSVSLHAAIEGGQLDLPPGSMLSLPGRSEFSAKLNASPEQPTRLSARGAMGGRSVDLDVQGPDIAIFARGDERSPLKLRLTIGDARIDAEGTVDRRGAGQGRVQVSGNRLDRLGQLIGVPLPQARAYSASGSVTASAENFGVTDLDVRFGRSRLVGALQINHRPSGRPLHRATLRAPVLHLEDIGVSRLPRDSGAAGGGEPRPAPADQRPDAGIGDWLDLLRAADFEAAIDIDALHSAGEQFARGRLRATSRAGALHLLLQDALTAGGGLDADILIDAGATPPKFGLQARLKGVEYGPFVRGLDPGSTMAGTLDLVADLSAQGPPANLLPVLAGTVDAAVYPRGLHSPALGVWGAGMLAALVRQLDPDAASAVDCSVASFDISRGVASSSAFFIDATRVRVIGQLEVDLTTRRLSGRIDPLSKQPALLTIAPTMLLDGTIESPKVVSAPANVVTVPLRFARSLVGFALDWRSARGGARDSAPGCREAFEQIRQARAGEQ